MCWRPVVCLKKKKPSATSMMDFLLEKEKIFIIHGRLQNIWIQENMEPTGQTPAEMH